MPVYVFTYMSIHIPVHMSSHMCINMAITHLLGFVFAVYCVICAVIAIVALDDIAFSVVFVAAQPCPNLLLLRFRRYTFALLGR